MNIDKLPLQIELVPSTAWFKNLRSEFSKNEWDIIRHFVYARANHQCEICGDTGKNQGYNHAVEAHEEWYYVNGVQSLAKITALCPLCHKCKHAGLAQIRGEIDIVITHLCKVNQITKQVAVKQLNNAFNLWQARSRQDWQLDSKTLDDVKLWLKRHEK